MSGEHIVAEFSNVSARATVIGIAEINLSGIESIPEMVKPFGIGSDEIEDALLRIS